MAINTVFTEQKSRSSHVKKCMSYSIILVLSDIITRYFLVVAWHSGSVVGLDQRD